MLTQWLLPTPTLGMFFSTVVVWESNGAFGPKNKERRESIQSQCRDAFRREIIIERRIEHWFVQILLAQRGFRVILPANTSLKLKYLNANSAWS